MSLITPTIGRKVWYWAEKPSDPSVQPEDATICYVHSPSMVNLRVTSHTGGTRPVSSVYLIPSNDSLQTREDVDYATWMPYQVGQATKEAEKAAQVQVPGEGKPAGVTTAVASPASPPSPAPLPSTPPLPPPVPGKPLG